MSDSNSKTDGSNTESEDEDDSVSQEVQGKDEYLWRTEPKTAKRSFLTKADAGTIQYAFDHANDFTSLSIAPKKNKRLVFLSTMHATRSHDTVIGKEEINVFYNHEKGGVDSHDQMCALYTTEGKTNRWPIKVFYGIVDSSALNAFVIFTHNTLGFGGNRKDKRQKFLKELFKSLIVPQAKRRLVTPQTPQVVK